MPFPIQSDVRIGKLLFCEFSEAIICSTMSIRLTSLQWNVRLNFCCVEIYFNVKPSTGKPNCRKNILFYPRNITGSTNDVNFVLFSCFGNVCILTKQPKSSDFVRNRFLLQQNVQIPVDIFYIRQGYLYSNVQLFCVISWCELFSCRRTKR